MYRSMKLAIASAMTLCLVVSVQAAHTPLVRFDMEQVGSPIVDTVGGLPAAEDAIQGGIYGYGLPGPATWGNAVSVDRNGGWDLSQADSASLRTLVNDFSVSAWVYLDSSLSRNYPGINQGFYGIIGDDNMWDGDGWSFAVLEDGRINLGKNLVADVTSAGSYVPKDKWIHLALNVSSTTGVDYYVNGAFVENNGNTSNLQLPDSWVNNATTDDVWGVGRANDLLSRAWAGKLDEVRVNDGLLNAQEIADLARVPEPASLALLGAGALMILASRRRDR